MATVNINGMEFDLDTLSDDAKAQLGMMQVVDVEISRLEAQLAIHRTARNAYSKALVEAVPLLSLGDRETIEFN
jgi:hypothetical protein